MTNFDKPDYNSKDLRLHRKYILVLCFILFILRYGGVKLDHVSLLGTSFSFENNQAIFLGLWIILFYSIFRYYQFFRHESWGHLKSEFQEIRTRFYENKFLFLLSENVKPKIPQVLVRRKKGYHEHAPNYFNGATIGLLNRRYIYQVAVLESEDKEDDVKHITVDFKYNLLKDFSWQTLIATWHFVFNTPFFFEFLFPFILLLGTLIYCGFGRWEGSLRSIF